MKTQTISQMAQAFGLSRSTLLYYDKISLLSPAGRSLAGYRLYTDREIRRMEEIYALRDAGVSLLQIKKILSATTSKRTDILRERLAAITRDIAHLRGQQLLIARLLDDPSLGRASKAMSREQWIRCLERAGLNEDGRDRWHREFEAASPESHQDFLESLGLPADEIEKIRTYYRKQLDRKIKTKAVS